MTLRVGLIQTRTPASHAAALDHLAPLVREAAAKGATFIATPEASNILQKDKAALLPQLKLLAEDPVVLGMQALAKELGVWLLIGSALVLREDGKAANRAALISPNGEITATYDKLHMFDVDLPTGESARESETYEPGDRAVTALAGETPLGLTICYDMRFPAVYRALALAGAQVMMVPAAFTRPTGEAHWEILLRARAIETGSFVLAPAQGGFHEDRRGTWGHTLAIAPWGEILGELAHDEPGVLVVDLDLAAVGKARSAIPALANARAFAPPAALA
ncbi:MAG: carbon-nitrogen hydrolase family protein [Phenylobacterium sp.]|uniref:carbon-nitrogen hydrolase family protein n=1 Tax=Phenylobacterium sp. TaxID=1871053 RepID=UPI002724D263|nr:carbon-nitrogen hydrolase family protein [Phenylobacterium sp.]MDO8910383.1 carbon-nitrogen hydrolase family protein [Phenylobacterium sp.]MDP3102362.1 carbon-nitrogen hydrolase family protein [Phenylobacterium sp.]